MEAELKQTTLETVGGGAVPELFQRELANIMANIDDENTPAQAKRSIVIEVTFLPDENREAIVTTVSCKSKIIPVKPAASLIYAVRKNGKLSAYNRPVMQGREIFPPKAVAIGGHVYNTDDDGKEGA